MPARLRPTAPLASDAILVGDPGRSLLLAQELLEQPKMSNHARGLWGYTGYTAANDALTIQATGMGGPSAALVLADLAKLGVERVVRVGTCAAFEPTLQMGELILSAAALAVAGSGTSFGVAPGEIVQPDPLLFENLRTELGDEAQAMTVASLDTMPADADPSEASAAAAADMQTVAVLARSRALGIAAAAVLIVTESEGGKVFAGEALEQAAVRAGRAAAGALSNPQV